MKKQPKYAQHLEELEHQLVQDPDSVDLLLDIGFIYFDRAHMPEAALKFYKKALAIEPNNVNILHWIALVYFLECCDAGTAQNILEQALAIEPSDPGCLSLFADVIQDSLSASPTHRLSYINGALQAAHDWPALHTQLAICLAQMGRWEEAETEIATTYELLKLPSPEPGNEREAYFKHAVVGRGSNNRELADLVAKRIRDRRQQGFQSYS